MQIREIQARSILTPQQLGSLASHYDFTLNPYAGCAFSCSYCYVPKFPNRDHQPDEWGTWVNVKVNAAELIRRDRLKIFGSRIFFSSATDPYQYLELKYQLTRRCLIELLRYQPAKLTLHTRSHLMLRDLDLLKQFGDRLSVGVSLTTDREDVAHEFEPKAPAIARRVDLIRRSKDNGINVFCSVSPLLPCNAEQFADLLAELVDRIWIDELRWPEVSTRPQLLEKYADFFDEDFYGAVINQIKRRFAEAA